MKVMKFGGTSVGKPERMHHISSLVTSQKEPTIVVLSALSGTTNALESTLTAANGSGLGGAGTVVVQQQAQVRLDNASIGNKTLTLNSFLDYSPTGGLLNLAGQDYHLNPLTTYAELPRKRLFEARLNFEF